MAQSNGSTSKWHGRLKKVALLNNILAVVVLFLAAVLIFLYFQLQ